MSRLTSALLSIVMLVFIWVNTNVFTVAENYPVAIEIASAQGDTCNQRPRGEFEVWLGQHHTTPECEYILFVGYDNCWSERTCFIELTREQMFLVYIAKIILQGS